MFQKGESRMPWHLHSWSFLQYPLPDTKKKETYLLWDFESFEQCNELLFYVSLLKEKDAHVKQHESTKGRILTSRLRQKTFDICILPEKQISKITWKTFGTSNNRQAVFCGRGALQTEDSSAVFTEDKEIRETSGTLLMAGLFCPRPDLRVLVRTRVSSSCMGWSLSLISSLDQSSTSSAPSSSSDRSTSGERSAINKKNEGNLDCLHSVPLGASISKDVFCFWVWSLQTRKLCQRKDRKVTCVPTVLCLLAVQWGRGVWQKQWGGEIQWWQWAVGSGQWGPRQQWHTIMSPVGQKKKKPGGSTSHFFFSKTPNRQLSCMKGAKRPKRLRPLTYVPIAVFFFVFFVFFFTF